MNSSGNIEILKKQNLINQSLVFKMNKQNKFKVISSLNSSNCNNSRDIPITYKAINVKMEGVYKNRIVQSKNQNLSSKNVRQFTRS